MTSPRNWPGCRHDPACLPYAKPIDRSMSDVVKRLKSQWMSLTIVALFVVAWVTPRDSGHARPGRLREDRRHRADLFHVGPDAEGGGVKARADGLARTPLYSGFQLSLHAAVLLGSHRDALQSWRDRDEDTFKTPGQGAGLVLTATHRSTGEGRPIPSSGYSWARTGWAGLRLKCWSGSKSGLRDAKHLSDTPGHRSWVAGVANPATRPFGPLRSSAVCSRCCVAARQSRLSLQQHNHPAAR